MLMGCHIALSLLIKGALKYHTYVNFKQCSRGNIELNLMGKSKFKLPKGARRWDKSGSRKRWYQETKILDNQLPPPARL
jgi:hypothetical protein